MSTVHYSNWWHETLQENMDPAQLWGEMLPIKKGYTVLTVDDKGQDWKDPCSSCWKDYTLFIYFCTHYWMKCFYNCFSFVNSDHSMWNSCIHKAKHKMHHKHMWGIHTSSFRCRQGRYQGSDCLTGKVLIQMDIPAGAERDKHFNDIRLLWSFILHCLICIWQVSSSPVFVYCHLFSSL